MVTMVAAKKPPVVRGVRISPGLYQDPNNPNRVVRSVNGVLRIPRVTRTTGGAFGGGPLKPPGLPGSPTTGVPTGPGPNGDTGINPDPNRLGNAGAGVPTGPDVGGDTGISGTAVNPATGMFPTERMFEPKNYQGSPLYQWQVQTGEDQLAKSLAAKGLTNSGAAIRQELNIPLQAAANDTDRITNLANANADRYANYQQNEAGRLERAGNNQWDRAFSLAQLMASQSPWTAALAGLNNSADIMSQAGQSQANYLRDAYARILGGGGGTGAGYTPIPVPGGPNYSNITPAQIGGNYSSNKGWIDLLTTGLSNLF